MRGRRVGAPVIHKDKFVRMACQGLAELSLKFGDVLLLVVEGDDDGNLRLDVWHGRLSLPCGKAEASEKFVAP
nr:hypothetical protein [Verrucomicrobium spinosum]